MVQKGHTGDQGATDPFRACFSKPNWGNFQTYINGLILGDDGDKNVMDIASFALDGKSQSSLNRFLQRFGPAVRRADRLRLRMSMQGRKGGCLIIDDTLIEKTDRHMEGRGSYSITVRIGTSGRSMTDRNLE